MSSQKEVVLDKIRHHLQSKFKRYPDAQLHIDQQLLEISKKDTLSKNDLDQIENNLKIILRARSTSQKSSQREISLKHDSSFSTKDNNMVEKPRSRLSSKGSIEVERSVNSRKGSANRKYRVLPGALSRAPGYCDNSLYFLSKMDLNLLTNNGVLEKNIVLPKSKANASFTIENPRSESPLPRLNQSFHATEQLENDKLKSIHTQYGHLLPPTKKMIEREQKLKEDYWHKIENFYTQKEDIKQKEKDDQKKLQKSKWVDDLKKQVEEKRKNLDLEKQKDYEDGKKFIDRETTFHQEIMEKNRRHKEFITICEKANYFTDMKTLMEKSFNKHREKAREVSEAERQNHTNYEEQEKERKQRVKSTNEWKTEYESAIQRNTQNSSLTKEKEKIDEEKMQKVWTEKQDREDNYRKDYLDGLKKKGLKNINSNVTSQKSWEQTEPDAGVILETHPDSDTGLMKFVYSDKKLQAKKKQLRAQLQQINQFRQQQALDKIQKETLHKNISHEQHDLWKNQEDQFAVREKLTQEAERLKKIAQREALDTQIKEAQKLKKGSFHEKDRRLYKTVLKNVEDDSKKDSF